MCSSSRPGAARRATRAWNGGVALALLLAAAGCDALGSMSALKGHVPQAHADVSGVMLPEVHPQRPSVPFRFRAQAGHLLVVYFGYTNCPDICPTTLSDLRRARRGLARNADRIDVAFVTVDPYRDTASVIVPYLASFVPNGHALRPDTQPELAAVERAFGATSTVTKQPSGELQVDHTAVAYVVDDRGQIEVEWDFGTSDKDMAHDLAILLSRVPAGGAGASVHVVDAWARASPAMARMGAAYATLVSAAGDRLTGVRVPATVAARAELHEVATDAAGRVSMRQVSGIELPAGKAVALAPGASHIMLVEIVHPLAAGDTLRVTLTFAKAPSLDVAVPVRAEPPGS